VYGLVVESGMRPDAVDEWLAAPSEAEQAEVDDFIEELGVSHV
jgi:hypothetical protein